MTLAPERVLPEAVDRVGASHRRPAARLRRLFRGPDSDPAWSRPALLLLLGLTAVGYVWGLDRLGWANTYYSAAAQAASRSAKAFFFGSADSANFITIDKPPGSIWLMDLSVRLFGLSSWSLLVPQAAEGVALVAVVHGMVRRWFSAPAALLAAFVAAITPVALLMFRFDDPDALLTLLLAVAAYCTLRALEKGSTRWLLLAATVLGMGFLTKLLEVLVVVPALVLAYLVAAPGPFRRRLGQVAMSGAVFVVVSLSWVAAVMLTPAADRPFIGSTKDNNLFDLILSYNGIGRLSGNEVAGGVDHGRATQSVPGLFRLFRPPIGGQVTWLLLPALAFFVLLLWQRRRHPRTDPVRAATLVFGVWLLVAGAVFSFAHGIFHAYYTVAMVPPIAVLVGVGGLVCWQQRHRLTTRLLLAAALGATGIRACTLLTRVADTPTWFALGVLALGVALALLIGTNVRLPGVATGWVAGACVLVASAGPLYFSAATIGATHSDGDPLAGPVPLLYVLNPPLPPPGPALVRALRTDAAHYEWAAAAVGGDRVANDQLASGQPIMELGGFHGTLPLPTLARFERYVRQGRIHYFVPAPKNEDAMLRGTEAARISRWVAGHFRADLVDGQVLYDLGRPVAG